MTLKSELLEAIFSGDLKVQFLMSVLLNVKYTTLHGPCFEARNSLEDARRCFYFLTVEIVQRRSDSFKVEGNIRKASNAIYAA